MLGTGEYYHFERTGSKSISTTSCVIHRWYKSKSLCRTVSISIDEEKYLKKDTSSSKRCGVCQIVFNTYQDLENMPIENNRPRGRNNS